MAVNPLGMNQGTQNFIRFEDDSGTINTQVIDVRQGTVTSVTNLAGGTLAKITSLSGGTLTTIPNTPGGTLGLVTRVGNVGTVEVGTITTMPNIPGGTIGVVSNLTNGSIKITAGTVGGAGATAVALSGNPVPVAGVDSGGTIYGLAVDTKGQQLIGGGTIGMLNAGTVTSVGTLPGVGVVTSVTNLASGTLLNSGTTTGVGVVTSITNLASGTLLNSGTTTGVGIVSMLSAGTVSMINAGTLTSLGTVPGVGVVTTVTSLSNGTIGAGTVAVSAGTITHGTIDAGTVRTDARNTQSLLTYGTQISGTAAIAGTVIGSASVGAGTSIWINDFSVINPYGTVLTVLGFGTAQQGTNVIFRGVLGTQTGPGIEKQYSKLTNSGMTNQDLVLSLGGAGTVDLSISYIISA